MVFAHQKQITRVRARQCSYDFSFRIMLDGEIFPGVNDQIELSVQQSFAKSCVKTPFSGICHNGSLWFLSPRDS